MLLETMAGRWDLAWHDLYTVWICRISTFISGYLFADTRIILTHHHDFGRPWGLRGGQDPVTLAHFNRSLVSKFRVHKCK
jgi:hypothetical protein